MVFSNNTCNDNNSNSSNGTSLLATSFNNINNNNINNNIINYNFVNFLEYKNCSNHYNNNDQINNINNINKNNNKYNKNKNYVKEYIIMFKKYIDQKEHHKYLSEIFKKVSNLSNTKNIFNGLQWKVIPRNNSASKYPSDFALVEFTLKQEEETKNNNKIEIERILNLLKQDNDIRFIFPEKKIDGTQLFKKWEENNSNNNNNNNNYDSDNNNDNSNEIINSDLNNEEFSELKYLHKNGKIHQEIPNYDDYNEEYGDINEIKSYYKKNKTNNYSSRKLVSTNDNIQVTELFNTKKLWNEGYSGKGVKVAIFDTGLSADHPHFKNIFETDDWAKEGDSTDRVGHGTFVAGIIASKSEKCLGFAPDSELHIFRVFNSQKESFTSWFIDAFNEAIVRKIDVLNLSIGGPDFMDRPFVEKVWEMSANNIIVVSAIGNDGPLYGTLNNPADQSDVIGVGGIDYSDTLSTFSSRGMTTWELPEGYGRVKPDILAYGSGVYGSSFKGDACKPLSGTSVSSPVVTGAISLLISSVKDRSIINPASMKQVLMESADKIKHAGIFEQGSGKLNILGAKQLLDTYKPRVSVSPSQLDFLPSTINGKEQCVYLWPYCTQKLYHSGLPIIVNATIINGINVAGEIKDVYWNASRNGNHLQVSFSYQPNIWPWTGHIGIFITVPEESSNFDGVAEGVVEITVATPMPGSNEINYQVVKLPVRAQVIPKPPRERRILWDQFHNLRYPIGFFPRDVLKIRNEPFDWNGDHLHTNFRKLYNKLVELGYFVEIIGSPLTCFDPRNYGTLMIVDPEEEFLPSEIKKIEEDVRNYGLNLIVFADWYNAEVMKMIEFYDENTQQLWSPATGGANIPALNDFLSVFGIYFGDSIYNGEVVVGDKVASISSGTSIIGFPAGGQILEASLTDFTRLIIKGRNSQSKVPILGFFQPTTMENDHFDESSSNSQSSFGSSGSGSQNDQSLDFDTVEPTDENDVKLSSSGVGGGSNDDEKFKRNTIVKKLSQQKKLVNKNLGKDNSMAGGDSTIYEAGQIVVFGDSNCLDETLQKDKFDCYWLIENVLNILKQGGPSIPEHFPSIGTLHRPLLPISKSLKKLELPLRTTDEGSLKEMKKFSKVMKDESVQLATQCGNQIYPNQFPQYQWPHSEKYINITWNERDKVVPSLVIPNTHGRGDYLNDDISSQYVMASGYIAICLVLIFIIVMFFKNKSNNSRRNNIGIGTVSITSPNTLLSSNTSTSSSISNSTSNSISNSPLLQPSSITSTTIPLLGKNYSILKSEDEKV